MALQKTRAFWHLILNFNLVSLDVFLFGVDNHDLFLEVM